MYVPPFIVSNDEFTKIVETSDEWITTRTGIRQRHFSDGILTWQMGVHAARDAVSDAGIDAADIDMIIFTSVTPDYFSPSASCLVQRELGAVRACCFDINCACAGFVHALDMAHRYLSTSDMKNVLIVSGESLSKITNFEDRSTCVLFGDAAAACVVQRCEGVYACHLGADGAGADKIFARALQTHNPFCNDVDAQSLDGWSGATGHGLHMDGREVYKFATRVMPEAVEKCAEMLGISVDDIDVFVPHQANIRIVETAAARLKVPMDKFFVNIDKYGNTSSASIPICLHEMSQSGRVKRGDKVAIVGFGAGLIYGAAIFEW